MWRVVFETLIGWLDVLAVGLLVTLDVALLNGFMKDRFEGELDSSRTCRGRSLRSAYGLLLAGNAGKEGRLGGDVFVGGTEGFKRFLASIGLLSRSRFFGVSRVGLWLIEGMVIKCGSKWMTKGKIRRRRRSCCVYIERRVRCCWPPGKRRCDDRSCLIFAMDGK